MYVGGCHNAFRAWSGQWSAGHAIPLPGLQCNTILSMSHLQRAVSDGSRGYRFDVPQWPYDRGEFSAVRGLWDTNGRGHGQVVCPESVFPRSLSRKHGHDGLVIPE